MVIFIFSAVCDFKTRFRPLMSLCAYSNRFLMLPKHGNGDSACTSFMLKTFRSRPNPTWCILHRGLKTIWGNFQSAASDFYFWKKRNDWEYQKTTTTNLNRNHMAFSTQSARSVSYRFFFRSCASSRFSSQGDIQFYEEDNLLWIGPHYNSVLYLLIKSPQGYHRLRFNKKGFHLCNRWTKWTNMLAVLLYTFVWGMMGIVIMFMGHSEKGVLFYSTWLFLRGYKILTLWFVHLSTLLCLNYYFRVFMRVFHTSVSWWVLSGVQESVSPFKSPGLTSVF